MRMFPSPSSNSDPFPSPSSPAGKSYVEALREERERGWFEERLAFERSRGIRGGCNPKGLKGDDVQAQGDPPEQGGGEGLGEGVSICKRTLGRAENPGT